MGFIDSGQVEVEQEPLRMLDSIVGNNGFNRDIVTTNPVGIVYVDQDGEVERVNPIIMEIVGVTKDDNIYDKRSKVQSLLSLTLLGNRKTLLDHLRDGESVFFEEVEFTTLNGDRKYINLYGHATQGLDGEVQGSMLICREVSGYRDLQAQLLQAQKMEAVGQLACGIAHDFNNLLTIINGQTELTLMTLDPSLPIRKNINEIQKAAVKAANLTRQLLAFSRKQPMELSIVDINEVISDMYQMLRRTIGENIDLKIFSDLDLDSIEINLSHIEQVLVNMVVNARDAMPDGGLLVLETMNVELDQNYANRHSGVVPGAYVMLAISDTGCGMSEAVQAKAFDPFYTTKEVSKGTGLGLSTVNGIIKQSGGHIMLHTEKGKGTTFKIFFPAVGQKKENQPLRNNSEEIQRGTETILLVEDEEAVCETATRILSRIGYQVIAAKSGKDALDLSRKMQPVQLLLTDLGLPDMTGRDLANELKSNWPELKILLMSGYSPNAGDYNDELTESYPYLQKPFRLADLANKVREVISSETVIPTI